MILEENKPILEETNADKWHKAGYTGKGVTIALLDDGGLPREHMKSYYKNVHRPDEDTGHSTNVGFSAHQPAPDAQIVALNGKRGFNDAVAWLSLNKDKIDLINISLAGIAGSRVDKYLQLEALGIPVVCASGNDGYGDKISYPARYGFTMGIGAWYWNSDQVAFYSNGGEDLDAVAPSGIYMLRDDGHIWSVQGTSFASPWAVGMLALYVQWRNEHGLPKLTPEDARTFIHSNCIDVREKGFDFRSGHGLFYMPDPSTLKVPEHEPAPKPEEPAPTPTPEPEEPAPTPEIFYRVVTGSFGNRDNAETRIEDLERAGFDSFLLPFETDDGVTMFRVITGSFGVRENAQARVEVLQLKGFTSFIAIYEK